MSENPYRAPESQPSIPQDSEHELLSGSLNFEQYLKLKTIYRRSTRLNIFTGFVFCAAAFVIYTVATSASDFFPGQLAFGALGGLYALAGVLLAQRTVLGRYLGFLVALTFLALFPLGTLVGIYGLWLLAVAGPIFGKKRMMHDEIKKRFRERERLAKKNLTARDTKPQ